MEVLRSLGDLISIQKREDVSLEHLRALVRLKAPTNFPFVIIVDVGVRSFKVSLEDDGTPVLRSKVVQKLISQPASKKTTTVPNLTQVADQITSFDFQPRDPHTCSIDQIPSLNKGKHIFTYHPRVNSHVETVGHASGLGHSMGSKDAGSHSSHHSTPETTVAVNDKPLSKSNQCSGDRPNEALRIPPVSLERNE